MPVVTFQNQYYTFDVSLKNGINDISLGTAAIEELVISENIFQWYSSGYIIIDNLYLNLQRYSKVEIPNAKKIPIEQKYYKFRSDGRDTIHIKIRPNKNEQYSEFLDKNWILELEASIYDIEEMQGETTEAKTIKLYFHDKMYQMMTERNVEFSTAIKALELKNKSPYYATNNDRALQTGVAINELLKTAGFEKNCRLFDSDEWNNGDENNSVFYTSPSNSRVSQDLFYLLDIHCADQSYNYDPCLFRLERNTEFGKARQFSIKPISEYFKKAGNNSQSPKEYQLELFNIKRSSDSDTTTIGDKIIRVPTKPNTELRQNLYSYDYSTIESYQFMDFSPIDATTDITNRMLVNYNIINHQFNIQKDYISDAEDHIKGRYLEGIMSPEKVLLVPKNTYASEGKNTVVNYTLNFTESARFSEGRNKIIQSILFKNMSIGFSVMGASIRQPGRFIGIMQGMANNDQDYDNRLEGQFFITQVVHRFNPKQLTYFNDIVGVKMHLFSKEQQEIPYNDDVLVMQ